MSIKTKITQIVTAWEEPKYNVFHFLQSMNPAGKLIDVGCGNNSPYTIKTMFPNVNYTGIDVGDYNQTKPNLADRYIITSPETFADKIAEFDNEFDTAICSHNLEHCNDRKKTVKAIVKALREGGGYYICPFQAKKASNFQAVMQAV